MTNFFTFASGSGGNCSLYINGDTVILIDAGTTTKYIKACLTELGLSLFDITHIVLTHSHGDHIGALPVLRKHTRATLVCSKETALSVDLSLGESTVFSPGDSFTLGDCPVTTFETLHDASGSCGYTFGQGGGKLGYCTDLGRMTTGVYYALEGCDTLYIESNHDLNMLKNGPYPHYLKRRIMSDLGHLSNDDCAQTVASLYKNGSRNFVLGHLSRENNTPALALKTSKCALEGAGARADYTLWVAPAYGVCRLVAV